MAWSEQAARAAELEPQQHQLLLALRGLPDGREPTIGALAERLCVEHHTAVALVDKLEARGFVERERSVEDRRKVLLTLRPAGKKSSRSSRASTKRSSRRPVSHCSRR